MDLSKILSIAGKPGLFKIISQSRGGVVVASLNDGKKMTVGQTQRVSTLSDISVYTVEGDEPLKDILKSFHEFSGGEAIEISLNDSDELRNFFTGILPDHDEDRVYASDIKKMVKWYNLLLKEDMLDFSEEETEEGSDDESQPENPEEKED
ncbi:MAG TPA: DUF5606 domain-containing protein [Cryomorphaceae bacterium]|nr:DUF5606 domain-containing protein [Cryomorphaceae bacterium]